MTDIRTMTCIVCPVGCSLKVKLVDGRVEEVTGNTCEKGFDYAVTECTNPVRTLTSTVRVKGGELPVVPVKSDKPIPKGLMLPCMKVLNKVSLSAPVKIGDTVVRDILGTGADIVVTRDLNKKK